MVPGMIAIVLAALAVLMQLSVPAGAVPTDSQGFPAPGKLEYAIIRNGSEIGTYEMDFSREGNRYRVLTCTKVAFTLLGLTLFHLTSDSAEEWVGDRLDSFVSKSDDNGKVHDVEMRPEADGLSVTENGHTRLFHGTRLPGTLWHPETFQATRLIDPIDGKLRLIQVEDRGIEQITVRGEPVAAHHFSITGKKNFELWYDNSGHIVSMIYHLSDGSLVTAELR